MPRKQKESSQPKRIGFEILAVAILTLILVGGNTALLLSPLMDASVRSKIAHAESKNRTTMLRVMNPAGNTEEERTVYVAQNGDRPVLFYDGKLYDYKQLANGVVSEYTNPSTKLVKKPLMKVPEGTTLLRSQLSKDGKLLVFTFSTLVNFDFLNQQSNPSSQNTILNSVFAYNVDSNKISPLFTNKNLKNGTYPLSNLISDDNKYIAFDIYDCWECESAHPATVVFDLNTNNLKEVGLTSALEWLPDGNFQYKEYIPEACPQQDKAVFGDCFKDPAKLPFKKGSWK